MFKHINFDAMLKKVEQENQYKIGLEDPFANPGEPTGFEGWTEEQFAAKFGPEINREEEMV